MERDAKIYVAGHRGLVGSAVSRVFRAAGYENLVGRTHEALDLQNQAEVLDFFAEERPEFVLLAAARVGGIMANNSYPADFIYSNLQIQNNIIDACHRFSAKKLLFLGSSCIYPKFANQPMSEDQLLGGKLEPTNEPYAVAKIAGIVMCQSYNRQYGTDFISAMPTNLYGPGDNYHAENSHVIPGLIRRFHEARLENRPEVAIWGTGRPLREFLYSDDCARACLFLMQQYSVRGEAGGGSIVNIGSGIEIPIADLAVAVSRAVGYQGAVRFDTTKPDGTPRKLLDVSRLHAMGWRHSVELEEGLKLAYADFNKNQGQLAPEVAH